jgi:hypothetical protein
LSAFWNLWLKVSGRAQEELAEQKSRLQHQRKPVGVAFLCKGEGLEPFCNLKNESAFSSRHALHAQHGAQHFIKAFFTGSLRHAASAPRIKCCVSQSE